MPQKLRNHRNLCPKYQSGTYEVADDLFTFLTDNAIDPEADSGTYRWSYEDGILKFNVIEDADRLRYAFITYPWVLTE